MQPPLDADATRIARHKSRDFSRMIAPRSMRPRIERDGIIVVWHSIE